MRMSFATASPAFAISPALHGPNHRDVRLISYARAKVVLHLGRKAQRAIVVRVVEALGTVDHAGLANGPIGVAEQHERGLVLRKIVVIHELLRGAVAVGVALQQRVADPLGIVAVDIVVVLAVVAN